MEALLQIPNSSGYAKKKSVYKQLTTRPPTDQEIVWYQVRSALHENTYTYAIYCTAFKCGASQSIRKLTKNVL